MDEIEIETIEDYLKLIKQHKEQKLSEGNFMDFLFRGQVADYPLIPKICRLKAKGNLLDVEKLLLFEFKRTNPLLIKEHMPLDDWDYLTLGQHFGLPTRLLDWSNNALTALWFATGGTSTSYDSEQKQAVVWILMASTEDFDLKIETMHPFNVAETKVFRPRIIKQRINNQSGVFSVVSSKDIIEMNYMNEVDTFKDKLVKVKISASRFKNIRTDLNTLGVNAFSIFPELEGLCTYLQWRYFE